MSNIKFAIQLFSLLLITIVLNSCVPNVDLEANLAYKINITSSPVTAVTFNSAVCGGTVNSTGGVDLLERGVCYATTPFPTIKNIRAKAASAVLGSYQVTLSGLNSDTKYFVASYAISVKDTAYGEQLEFTTTSLLPVVTTNDVAAITTSNAQVFSTLVSVGASPIEQRGVCWATTANPTIANEKTSDGTATGIITSAILGLKQNTRYFVRAYAKNGNGVAYGRELSFNTPQPTTEDLNEVQFISNNIGFIAGNKVLLKTINGGDTWTKIRESSSVNFTSIHFENENLGYAGGNDQNYAYLYKTTDGGLSWAQVTREWNGNERLKITGIFTSGSNTVSFLFNAYPNASQVSGTIAFSSDGGVNWTRTKASKIVGFNCGDMNTDGKVYIGSSNYWAGTTNNCSIFTSTFLANGSKTVTEKNLDGIADLYGIDMNGIKGYAVGSNGKYFTSGDGGLNWSMRTIAGYSAETMNAVLFKDGNKGFIAGTNGLLLKTIDGGLSWFKEPTDSVEEFTSIAIKPDGTVFVVGTKGEIFRKIL
jgi:photosystem II stability/assembly factor-like uncharacterized protein